MVAWDFTLIPYLQFLRSNFIFNFMAMEKWHNELIFTMVDHSPESKFHMLITSLHVNVVWSK